MFMLESEMISRRSLLALASIASGASLAQPRPSEDIYLVQGVTFIGTPDQQVSAAPYILELNRDEGFRKAMENRIRSAAASLRIKSGHRIQENLASVQGDTYALSFAVTGERVEVERVGGTQFNIQYRLRVLVLVMNMSVKPENRKIVSVYNVPVTYLTLGDRPPSKSQRLEMFRRLYLDPPAGADAISAWLKVASSLELREGNVWVKIAPFTLNPKASRMMTEAGIGAPEIAQMSRRFTSDAEDGISGRFNIPVIPSVSGDAVESAIVFTFNDSSLAQQIFGSTNSAGKQELFAFPEPSWIIEMSAKDYRYARSKQMSPGGNPVDIIDVALAIELNVRPASPSHPIPPLQTTFFKRENKAFIDPSRIVESSADTNRLSERLMIEIIDFMANPASGDSWLKVAHIFPERTASIKSLMQRISQQFSTRR